MRSGFEAADSGVLIWRTRPFILLLFLGIPALATAILTRNINFSFYYYFENEVPFRFCIVVFSLWWLKPLFDRFALHIVSKLFFYRDANIKELCSSLYKNIIPGILGDLLWRRFSPIRGAALAIRMLEKQKGKQYRTRKKILANNGLNFGIYLTIICVILEIALSVSAYIFIYACLMILNIEFTSIFGDSMLCGIFFAFYFINYCIVETLYIAMNFALYINSRVITEGWDLEIIFRKLASKKRVE
jgi:hypothetical protein